MTNPGPFASPFKPPRTSFELAIALLNTWDLLADPPELLRGPEHLERFLQWSERSAGRVPFAADVARVIAARDILRQALEAWTEAEAVALLNELAMESGTKRQLRWLDDHWQFTYLDPDGDPCRALIGEAAEGALEAMRDGDWDRLGICEGDPCRCVYVDRTKNRSRRYCCELCTNRTMQARHRERRRARRPAINPNPKEVPRG
jgi:predicted RNA-binding Zn ribbon-like protein